MSQVVHGYSVRGPTDPYTPLISEEPLIQAGRLRPGADYSIENEAGPHHRRASSHAHARLGENDLAVPSREASVSSTETRAGRPSEDHLRVARTGIDPSLVGSIG